MNKEVENSNKIGRPRGSRNKDKQAVRDRLEELGCDPLEGMVIIASEAMQDAQTAYATMLHDLNQIDGTPEEVAIAVQKYITHNLSMRNDSFELAGKMYKELAQYAHAKLKSVDLAITEMPEIILNGTTGLPVAVQPASETDAGV